MQGDERVGAVAGWHGRGQHVDLDPGGLQQHGGAASDVQVDLPFLLAAADSATLEPTQLGRDLLGEPVAGLESDAALPGRVIQRRGRKWRTERAEKVLRP